MNNQAQVKLAHSTEENTKLQSSLNELRGKLERFELEFKSQVKLRNELFQNPDSTNCIRTKLLKIDQAELVADLYSQIKTKTNSIEKFTIDLTQSREDVHHKVNITKFIEQGNTRCFLNFQTEELETEKEMHNSQKAEVIEIYIKFRIILKILKFCQLKVAKLNEKNNQLEKKLADLENQLELQKVINFFCLV